MEPSAEAPPSVSAVLDQMLATDRPITVGELFDRIEERGYGLLMIMLGLPMLFPVLPPGASTIVGLVYSLLALQLLFGRDRPWLPVRLRRRSLSAKTMASLRQRGVSLVRRLEKFSRPRFHVLKHPVAVRVVALIVLALGVILASPAPFQNLAPTVALILIGIGLLNDDGLFVLLGTVLGLVVIGVFAATVGLIVELVKKVLPLVKRAVP